MRKRLISTTDKDELQNGQVIGEVSSLGYLLNEPGTPIVLKNSNGRFGNPYTNTFRGWMFVADAGYSFGDKSLLWTVTGGVASGDDNPNFETKDGTFDGFIGLQETYSGKRVRSVYLLGGAGKLKRLFSTPDPDTRYSSTNYQSTSSFWIFKLSFCWYCIKMESKIMEKIL